MHDRCDERENRGERFADTDFDVDVVTFSRVKVGVGDLRERPCQLDFFDHASGF
jgi:hypothetical protein